uniref:C2H2-type domain-containing protein n=1 Tax=Globodera pallida TaxID=36090 RepID=A0A183CIX6_GLOPA
MFQHDLGLINHLVVQQQQQQQRQIKKEISEEQQQQRMNNQTKCAGGGASHQQHRHPQRIPSASSSISSGVASEPDMARTSPTALINNLLGRNSSSTHQLQQQQQQLNEQLGNRGNNNVIGHQIGPNSAGLNGALLQGIDFAANQLANYAGHFHDQLDMNSLFGTNNIAGVAAGPFSVYSTPGPISSMHVASIASTADNSVPLSAAGIASHRRQRSTAGNSLKCLYCPKKVIGGQAELQAHLEDCRLLRMHECNQCGKRFKARGGLQQHSKIHINDRPYHCHYCPKRFTQKSHLDQHERIHTGLKPFTCQYCGRQFRQRSQQLGHEATHVNRERHSMGGLSSMSAAVLGGLVGAAGGYGETMCGRERGVPNVAQKQQQEMAAAAAAGTQLSPQQQQQQQAGQSSPTRPLLCPGRSTESINGHGTRHFQRQQQLANTDLCCGGGGINTSAMAHTHQQQMNSFNGLLRAVQSNDSAAVDGLLGLRGSIPMKQQHGHSGMELNEQLQLVSAQLMNR